MPSLDIEAAIGQGLVFLEKQQETDGKFLSFSSRSIWPFKALRSWQTTFVPALMLVSLAGLDTPQALRIRKRLAGFLLEQKDGNGAFNYWAKNAPEYQTQLYPNDLDDTFCALAALRLHDPSLVGEAVLAQAVKLLLATEITVGGPYRTWLVPPDSNRIWLDVDVAVNSNVAYFLSLAGSRLPALDTLMDEAIMADNFSSPYYPSICAYIYYFARSYSGPHKDQLLRKARRLHKTAVTDLDRALCLNARLRLGETQDLAAAVGQLISGQKRDGSWAAAGFYADPVKDGKSYYNGAAALTTAFVLEALQRYAQTGWLVSTAPVKKQGLRRNSSIQATVVALARRQCRPLPIDLRRAAIGCVGDLATSANGPEIIALPQRFNQSLLQPLSALSKGFLENLSLANLWGWLAYTIYDDFLDEEGQPGLLPVANVALRNSLAGFLGSLPADHTFNGTVRQVFDTIDGANAWELSHCRYERRQDEITIGTLPDYGDSSKLAERSLGHTLAPLAVLSALKMDSAAPAFQQTRRALAGYLIVRQLNDDLHDWQTDLTNGQITYVVSRILSGMRVRPGKYQCTDLITKARQEFWHHTLPAVCHEMRLRIAASRRAIDKAAIFKERNAIGQLLDGIDASVQDTLAKQAEAENFLRHYRQEVKII